MGRDRGASRRGWTAVKRRAFLDHLAEHCNVNAACRAVGMDPSGAYALRRRDPDFAAQWREALEIAYERLETALLRYSIERLNGGETDVGGVPSSDAAPSAGEARTADLQTAMQMLTGRHREEGAKAPGASGKAPRIATREETDAALRKHLDALARRLKKAREA